MMNDDKITVKHDLIPHREGGKYKELFKFEALSSMEYLLHKDDISYFHKLSNNDEIWYLIEGCSVIIHIFIKGEYKKIVLDEVNYEYRIPKNTYFAVENADKDTYSLSVCLFKPSINWEDMVIPNKSEMLSLFPEYKDLIIRLSSN